MTPPVAIAPIDTLLNTALLDVPGLHAAGLDVPGLHAAGLDTAGPDVSGLDAPGHVEEESGLGYRRCRWCNSATTAGCLLCPVCGSADLAAERSAGTGTVQRMLRPTRRGAHPGRPYLVTLDEGFSVQASISGSLPGAVPIGARVELAALDDEARILAFRVVPRG